MVRLRVFPILGLFLILTVSACGGESISLDSIQSPSSSLTNEEVQATETADVDSTTGQVSEQATPAFALGPPVSVTVILDLDGYIKGLIKDYGYQGWCLPKTILDNAGGQAVSLEVEGLDAPLSAKFQPSPMNGTDLPCQVEAVINDVPSGAASYVARQTGGEVNTNVAARASLTGEELERNGNLITLK